MAEPSKGCRKAHFVFFGDSIVGNAWNGWMAKLAALYSRTADITNRGLNGYNSTWALHALPEILPTAAPPALFVICFGANDALRPAPLRGRTSKASRHHVPLDEYARNLEAMIDSTSAKRVLLCTPPPTDGEAWLAFERRTKGAIPDGAESTRSNAVTGSYAARAVAVANARNVPVIDLWSAIQASRPNDW